MAASSGHLTPAEAATPVRTPLQRPNSVGSDVSRRSAVPTIASSLGNFRDHGANSQASGSGTQPVQRTASGRSIPAGYHLRGSRTPSLRDPNAHLDELKQVPERAEVVPPVPPLVSQASDQEDAAIRQAIKKGSKVFHRRRSKRSGDSESDGDSETASRKHFRRRETDSSVEQQTREARAQIAKRREKVIDLYDGDEQITSAGEVPAVERPQKPVYVWEVMYENQRGMSLFGKKWYSANSLLPSDPTAYTLPTELPGVTTISAAERSKRSKAARRRGHIRTRSASTSAVPDHRDSSGSGSSGDTKMSRPQAFKRRTNDTGYDLKTYQTPSPDWIWLTPWMVNMRADADEQGFRYNLWFHRRGWRPHAGPLNWWGWVRRREWMRLRVLLPSTPVEKEVDAIEGDEKEWPETLDDVMARPMPIRAMVKLLVVELLDRERIECFFQWWDDGTEEARLALKGELEDYDNLDLLSKAFVFGSSRRVFLTHLVTHKVITKTQADAILSRLFDTLSPSTSVASSPVIRPHSPQSSPSDSSHSPVPPKFARPTSPSTPTRGGPTQKHPEERPTHDPRPDHRSPSDQRFDHRSPASSFSSPPTPRTPTFRTPEPRHFPFNYVPPRTKPSEPSEPSLKEPSEGDVD